MKNIKNFLVSLGALIVILPGSVVAQSLSMNINSGASYNCEPGTTTLTVNAHAGYGCLLANAVSLEYSINGTTGWGVVKSYLSDQFSTNGNFYTLIFTDDISALTCSTGYYRFGIIGTWDYCCSGCCNTWCGPPTVYSPAYSAVFLWNNTGADKTHSPACNGRAQIGLASNIGPYNSCSPTYNWTWSGGGTSYLYPTQTGGSQCSPCTAAQYWAGPPAQKTYTRTMTCGGNVCADNVVVHYNGMGCKTALDGGDYSETKVQITPNPSTGHFTISANSSEISEIFIYNNLGQMVQHFKTSGSKEIFLENSGIYRIRVQNDNGVSTSTLMVN